MTTSMTDYPSASSSLPQSNGATKNVLGIKFEDDERNKKVLATVTDWYRACKNARAPVERQWYINLAFHAGRQNIRMVATPGVGNGFKLQVPKAPPWRVRLVVNRTRKYVRTELSKITSSRPRFFVVPATSEDEDLIAARVAEQIFDSVYSNYDLKAVIRQAEWWNVVCGIGYTKTYWDKLKLDEYSSKKGDFCYEAITPFNIYVPNLLEIDLQKQPYVIHAVTKSVDWVNNTFPQLKGKVNTDAASTTDILDSGFLNVIGARSVKKEEVLVLECWIKPGNSLMPNGGLAIIVGGQVASIVDGFPYKHNRYPFQKLENVESGRFYTTSVLEDLVPLQREYNRTRSQIIESKNMMAKPKLLAASGSIEAKQITSEPGQTIYYKMGYPAPTPLQLTALPNYVLQEVQQLQQDMDDLVGQHEVSRGQNPSQVTAATALSFLKEQDDTVIAGVIQSLESALEEMGRQTLGLAVQFWDSERMVRTVGADGTFDAQLYQASAIKKNQDIRVESGSALPQSKAAKQAFVMDLLKMGLIPPEKGLEMLDIGGIEKIYEDYLVDVRQAQRENQKMMMSIAQEPNDFDNHQVHLDVHNKFRKGQQFEALPDPIKEIFQQHVALHQQAMNTGLQPGGQFDPAMQLQPPVGEQGPPGAGPQTPGSTPPPGTPPLPGGM
jgi:hypothetical protein